MLPLLWTVPAALAAAVVILHFFLQSRRPTAVWSPRRGRTSDGLPRRVIRPEFRFDDPPPPD